MVKKSFEPPKKPGRRTLERSAYRQFLSPGVIDQAVAFIRENRPAFERAQREFGPPPELIAAIMSNVEAGRLRMEEREFDLRTECTPIFRNFIIQSHLHPFSFTYHIDPGIPSRLYGDPDRTKQILINLLDNAFKYTRQGQVTARIDLWRAEGTATAPPPGRVRLLVTIADTGIGIEPDRQKAVFEPFGIGEDYLTKKYSGAGLGLSIAKQLASMPASRKRLRSPSRA